MSFTAAFEIKWSMDNVRFRKVWPAIISALEREIPFYDKVGEWISLGAANRARKYAVKKSRLKHDMSILDVGAGTGLMSMAIRGTCEPIVHVALDFSLPMLQTVGRRFPSQGSSGLDRVRAVFEAMPFCADSFDRVYSAFALEDTAEKVLMISELRRVCKTGGVTTIVNMGKPDNRVSQALTSFYLRTVMLLMAKMLIIGKLRGNPWRLLIPVYDNLPTNHALIEKVRSLFGSVSCRKFLLGGILVLVSTKR